MDVRKAEMQEKIRIKERNETDKNSENEKHRK